MRIDGRDLELQEEPLHSDQVVAVVANKVDTKRHGLAKVWVWPR